jgi:hypothetical protein
VKHAPRPENVTVDKGYTGGQQKYGARHGPPLGMWRDARCDKDVRNEETSRSDVTQCVADREHGTGDWRDAVLCSRHCARADPGDGVEAAIEHGEPKRCQASRPPHNWPCRGQENPLCGSQQWENREQQDVQGRPPVSVGRVEWRRMSNAKAGKDQPRQRDEHGAQPSCSKHEPTLAGDRRPEC